MFIKSSNFLYQQNTRYKTVASRPVEIPYSRENGRQRGIRFGVVAQVIGRTTSPYLHKNVVSAEKRVGVDLMEVAAPEIAELLTVRKIFRSAAKNLGRYTLKKQLGSCSKQRTVIPTKFCNSASQSYRDLLTNISRSSCRTIFGTNLLCWFLETLEGKSQ